MKLKVLVVAGDGIGPEVTAEAVRVLRCVADVGGHDFVFTQALIGGAAIRAEGSPLSPKTLDLAKGSDAVLLGAVGGNEFNSLPPDRRARRRCGARRAPNNRGRSNQFHRAMLRRR